MVNAMLLCLNTQTPKMPHLAVLGNTIRLRAKRTEASPLEDIIT